MGAPRRREALVDARCLQDPNYAERGIGRHVLGFLRKAPLEAIRLVGIVDPDLPPLIPEAAGVFEEVVPSAYAAARVGGPGSCFLGLCTMTHDPLFVAQLVNDARLLRVALVYDFIPYRNAAFYLPSLADRLEYRTRLYWLSRYDLFAANSASVAEDLSGIVAPPASAVTVVGAPLDSGFEKAASPGANVRRHVLVVGGGDPRKNPEIVIRSHARSKQAQRGRIPLIVAGNYGVHDREKFQALHASEGGRPELLEVPGHVAEPELLRMYAEARLVVCPSRDEGFSLPVVEGMAAGAVVLVSDIPPHRELVASPELRFDPDDSEGLTAMLGRYLGDQKLAADVVAQQSSIWPQHRQVAKAARFWSFIVSRLDRDLNAAQAPARGLARTASASKPRIALLSPMPPDKTGIADYSATLCEHLARYAEVDVFTDTEGMLKTPGVSRVYPLSSLVPLQGSYDRIVAAMGNSSFHRETYTYLRRYGAACIAHDARMLGFYRYVIGADKAVEMATRELSRPVSPKEIEKWIEDESLLEAQCMGELAASSTPIIVHSAESASFIESRHGISAAYIPFAVQRPWADHELIPPARRAARAGLGIPETEVVIASFGSVHPTKAPEDCIWALDVARSWGMPASLHFVGSTEAMPDGGTGLKKLVKDLAIEDFVHFRDTYVSEELYREYLLAADFAVQLRTFGLGSISGALSDCAEVGLPTVVNRSLGDAMDAPALYIRKVDDGLSPILIAESLLELWQSGVTRDSVVEARAAFHEERSMDTYARRLCAVLGLPGFQGMLA